MRLYFVRQGRRISIKGIGGDSVGGGVRQYGRLREDLYAQLNLKQIVQMREQVETNCLNRKMPVDLGKVATLYADYCQLTRMQQEQQGRRKQLAGELARTAKVDRALRTMDEAISIRGTIDELSVRLTQTKEALQQEATLLPNSTHPDSPIGGAEANRLVEEFGPPLESLPFMTGSGVIDHVEIGRRLDIVDFEAAGRTSGASFYFLKGQGALLENALIQYAFKMAMEHGFEPILPPDIVYAKFVRGCGFFPRAEESRSALLPAYMAEIDGEQETASPAKVLAATAEIPLSASYHGRILQGGTLPHRLVALSHCFRPETGHHGSESRGLFRVHQFSKVELFILKDDDEQTSDRMLQELVELQRKILSGLGLRCRILEMATEELGASAYRKYDIEAYFPFRLAWGELTSASNCTDYQARRLGIRYRREGEEGGVQGERGTGQGKVRFAHTLNATACAIPRVIQAILENFQNADGTEVLIPPVLHPYMLDGSQVIRRKGRE